MPPGAARVRAWSIWVAFMLELKVEAKPVHFFLNVIIFASCYNWLTAACTYLLFIRHRQLSPVNAFSA